MTREIRTGYWYVPEPASTRGGQHVGTPQGVLVYDETLQLGVLSFSERSQFKNIAEANALLDLAAEASPGHVALTAADREALRDARACVVNGHPGMTKLEQERAIAILDRLASERS